MRHQSEAFGPRAVDEWLIYCKRFCKTFFIWICGEEKEYVLAGRLRLHGAISIELDTPDGLLEIDLENDEAWRWRIGTMRLAERPAGSLARLGAVGMMPLRARNGIRPMLDKLAPF